MTTLVDTSCLLRLPNSIDPRRKVTQDALDLLGNQGEKLVLARQNCVEFRGVATRPIAVNGLGLSPAEADAELDKLETVFPRLPERAGSSASGVTCAAGQACRASRFMTRAW